MNSTSINQMLLEFEELRYRLEEAEQTLEAIRQGEVDALVVYGDRGEQVFTLRGAEQPYREFVEQMQEGAASLASDGLILWANQRLADMLGIPLSQVIGVSLRDHVSTYDAEKLEAGLRAATTGVVRTELEVKGPGNPVPVLASISSIGFDSEAAFAVTLTDLSVQKRQEQVLASERVTRAILEQASEAIIVSDEEGRIVRSNHAAARLGLVSDGGTLAALPVRLDSGDGLDAVLALALAGTSVRSLAATVETGEGRRDLLVGMGPLGIDDGGVVLTLTDITERNAAYRLAQDLNESLERRVEERTDELMALNRELEGFCYSVSHDLRAPLRGMNSASNILIQDYGDRIPEEANRELLRIARNATRLATLMDDLLAFSRLGRQEMKKVEIDLSSLGRLVAEEHATEGVAVSIADDLATTGDPSLIRLLLGNLIGNAIKFTVGRPAASVWLEASEHPNTFVVRDNGIGFNPKYSDKIFLPFERLHAENEYPGTGIGLANVERITRRHGGRVWAEGTPEVGAKFYFRLVASP